MAKILKIETGDYRPGAKKEEPFAHVLDYRVYDSLPRLWRQLEKALRIDLYLALRTKAIAGQYDLIIAGSEKVGIPLALLNVKKPLIVVTHHMASRFKRKIVKWLRVTEKWSGVGCETLADKEFLHSYYNIPTKNIFPYETAKFLCHRPAGMVIDGPIISLGVAKRDYRTLIHALESLPGYDTEIFISSRFGDLYKGGRPKKLPPWICIQNRISDEDLINHYKRARFVVLPLRNTTQYSAGTNVALESMALGKALIATHTKGMETFVIDGRTGILVPPKDSKALEEAIRKLWHSPELSFQMGQAGRKLAEKNFDPKISNRKVSDFMERVYRDSRGHDFRPAR